MASMDLRARLASVPKRRAATRGSPAVRWFKQHWSEIESIRAEDETATWEGFAALMREDGVTYPLRPGEDEPKQADARLARQTHYRLKGRMTGEQPPAVRTPAVQPQRPKPERKPTEVPGTAAPVVQEQAANLRPRLRRIGDFMGSGEVGKGRDGDGSG